MKEFQFLYHRFCFDKKTIVDSEVFSAELVNVRLMKVHCYQNKNYYYEI